MSVITPLIYVRDAYFSRDFVSRNFSFAQCERQCSLTWDAGARLNADAVLWHSPWTSRAEEVEAERALAPPSQLWVWAAAEAPGRPWATPDETAGLHPPAPSLDRAFNASMTYRRDSDVMLNCGETRARGAPQEGDDEAQLREWFDRKQTPAAWVVSHCWTASRREEFAAELGKHIPVETLGKCAGPIGAIRAVGHAHNGEWIRKNVKMYLAFENRLCQDYITEKFWVKGLLYGAIPVVRGGASDADYAAVAPPNSYINADLFPTAAALAEHMNAVTTNFTLFRGYHAWRRTHELLSDSKENWARNGQAEGRAMCRLCSFVHVARRSSGAGSLNLTQFWSEGVQCRKPLDVPQVKVVTG